jgi:hypothetical protein
MNGSNRSLSNPSFAEVSPDSLQVRRRSGSVDIATGRPHLSPRLSSTLRAEAAFVRGLEQQDPDVIHALGEAQRARTWGTTSSRRTSTMSVLTSQGTISQRSSGWSALKSRLSVSTRGGFSKSASTNGTNALRSSPVLTDPLDDPANTLLEIYEACAPPCRSVDDLPGMDITDEGQRDLSVGCHSPLSLHEEKQASLDTWAANGPVPVCRCQPAVEEPQIEREVKPEDIPLPHSPREWSDAELGSRGKPRYGAFVLHGNIDDEMVMQREIEGHGEEWSVDMP